jgi:hypothetical protein
MSFVEMLESREMMSVSPMLPRAGTGASVPGIVMRSTAPKVTAGVLHVASVTSGQERVRVTVRAFDTRKCPLGASVLVRGLDRQKVYAYPTAANPTVELICNVTRGDYYGVDVSAPGYQTQTIRFQGNVGHTARFSVTLYH